MSARYRHLILWFLLLALPMQGWAIVTMLHCGSGHQAMVQERGDVHQHPVAEDAHADHGHRTTVMDETGSLSGDGEAADGQAVSQCSACASCCLGAALPTSSVPLGSSALRATLMTTVAAPVLSFFTSGPDRPPRLPLV